MKLKSSKPWHANSTANFPFVGIVEIDQNGEFEVEDHEDALKLIDSSIGIEPLEKIKSKAHSNELKNKGESLGEEDDTAEAKEIRNTIDLMSHDRLKEFAEEQGLPKNKWQRMGFEKLKEYVLTEMGL